MIRFVSWPHASLLLLALIPACGGDDSGGTGSTAQLIATCKKTCSKEKECFGAEANFLNCDQMCSPDKLQKSTSTGSSPKVTCDYTKLRSKFEACLSVQCSELDSCLSDATSSCDSSSSGDMPSGTTAPGKTTAPGVPGIGDSTPPSGSTPPGTPKPPSGSTPPATPGDDAGAGSPSVPPGGSSGSTADCSICEHANACCLGLIGLAGGDPSECDTISVSECKATPAAQQSAFVDLCTQTLEGGAAAGISECM